VTTTRWLVLGAVALAAAALAVALSLALTGGGPHKLSDADYARLYQETQVGESQDAVLRRWPKVPYQHYKDSVQDDCYEWSDEPAYLYNLCFKGGVLRSKQAF